jgi:hypothetical protein
MSSWKSEQTIVTKTSIACFLSYVEFRGEEKGDESKRGCGEGKEVGGIWKMVNMIKVYYTDVWKYHKETH